MLVIAPSYFAAALKANPATIKTFFIDVASKSPVPVYVRHPLKCFRLAKTHLTHADVALLTRITMMQRDIQLSTSCWWH